MNLKICKAVLAIALGLIVFSSCSNQSENLQTVTALPLENSVEANVISTEPESEFFNLKTIENVNDEYLVFADDIEKDVFKIFNLPSLEFIYAWGRMGKGPDELSFVSLRQVNALRNQLVFYEETYGRIKFYRVTDSTLSFNKEEDLSFVNKTNPINGLKILDDSTTVAHYGYGTPGSISDDEFIALSPGNREPLFTFGTYPETELEGPERFQEYSKVTAAKPDGSRFAAFYRKYNRFKIFDDSGSVLAEVNVEDPTLDNDASDNSDFIYRTAATAGNNYIYTLAINKSEKALQQNPNNIDLSVEVWNWDGEPVQRFYINPPTPQFAVSEKHNRLYGFSMAVDNVIYEYNLEGIVNQN